MTRTFLRRSACALALMTATLAIPSVAPAQDDPRAIELYGRGREALANGKPNEALPLLEESISRTKSPNTRLLIAHAYRDIGRKAKAHDTYELARREAEAEVAKGQARYADTAAEARRSADDLMPLLGSLRVDVPGGSRAEIARAADDVVSIPASATVWAEPGDLRITLVTGEQRQEKIVKVLAGSAQDVTFGSATTTIGPDSGRPPPPQLHGSAFGSLSIGGGVVAGLGVVGLGLFAGFGTGASSTYHQLEDCDTNPGCTITPAQAEDMRAGGERDQLIANVSLGVGLGLAAAGAVMIIVDGFNGPDEIAPGAPPQTRAKLSWTPWLAPSEHGASAGIHLTWE